jgi:1-acyl-sn-glycerol-3-phosphate acyltransferase
LVARSDNDSVISALMAETPASRTIFAGSYLRFNGVVKRSYEYIIFYILLFAFPLSCLAWSIVAAILYPFLPSRIGQPIGQVLIMSGFRYYLWLMRVAGVATFDIEALDTLRDKGPLVIISNHPTLLDAVLIGSRLPRLVCTAKAALLNSILIGALARLAGYIRNDAPAHVIRESVRQLQAGRQLLIFPEGTRTIGAEIDSFKGGFALIAKRAGVPVRTVFIETNSAFLGKGWPLLRKPDFPLSYRVKLGPPLAVTGIPQDFAAKIHDWYCDELAGKNS